MRLAVTVSASCVFLSLILFSPEVLASAKLEPTSLPLFFEENLGQTHQPARFIARGAGYAFFVTPSETVVRLRSTTRPVTEVLRMRWAGSRGAFRVQGVDELDSKSHYFIGNDANKWRSGVPNYAKVNLEAVYDGIDVVLYGSGRAIEYDFVVAPGADPRLIRLEFTGARRLCLEDGDLVAVMKHGTVRQRKPVAYQLIDGKRIDVETRFVVRSRRRAEFALGAYDRKHALVIDPVLDYSTYLGGSLTEAAIGIAVDGSAHAYVTGHTESLDFPVAPGAFQPVNRGSADGFVAKLSSDGSRLLYSTYFGGSHLDLPEDISTDTGGYAYVTGHTYSRDFPVTPDAFQPAHGGGNTDAFVLKLHPDGSRLMYSTYLGGSGEDRASEIANDYANRAVIAGSTTSPNFPVTPNAVQPENRGLSDAFVAKFDNDGSLVVSTYLGGPGNDGGAGISVDPPGDIYIGGAAGPGFPTTPNAFQPSYRGGSADGFISKIDRDGAVLLYSTYLGGTADDSVSSLEVNRQGEAHATGLTNSLDFPVTPNAVQPVHGGSFDVFITKMNETGSAPEFSTFLGGAAFDEGSGIDLDGAGNVYIMGRTLSPNFPVTANAFQPLWGGNFDAIVAKVNRTGTLLIFSSFLGGKLQDADEGPDVAVESATAMFVAGNTSSFDFPVTPGVFQPENRGSYDAFVTKIIHGPGEAAAVNADPLLSAQSVSKPHCVRTVVTDAVGNGVPGTDVRFEVAGLNNTAGTRPSDADAIAEFCYSSAALPGADVITVYVDTNRNQTLDGGEPKDTAHVTWIVP